jgi:hypothetical protein
MALGFPVDLSPKNAVVVTLATDTPFSTNIPRGVWVGTGGDLKVDFVESGTGIVLKNVPDGGYVTGAFSKIYSTTNGTTCTDLVAVY